jgi:chemotaxis receptor (MCP) glutamine deamidase CheD
LKTKAFGGDPILKPAEAFTNSIFTVGEVIDRFIRGFLQNETLSMVSSFFGGAIGRVIFSQVYPVYVKEIVATDSKPVKKEEQCLAKSIQKQEEFEMQINLR